MRTLTFQGVAGKSVDADVCALRTTAGGVRSTRTEMPRGSGRHRIHFSCKNVDADHNGTLAKLPSVEEHKQRMTGFSHRPTLALLDHPRHRTVRKRSTGSMWVGRQGARGELMCFAGLRNSVEYPKWPVAG